MPADTLTITVTSPFLFIFIFGTHFHTDKTEKTYTNIQNTYIIVTLRVCLEIVLEVATF